MLRKQEKCLIGAAPIWYHASGFCLLASTVRSAPMDAALQAQLSIAALVCSVAALFFSLLAAFPGLKAVLAVVRDGVLWFALFLVLGGMAFVVWQHVQQNPLRAEQAAVAGVKGKVSGE